MNGDITGGKPELFIALLVIALAFGFGYAALVRRARKKGVIDRYTSLMVVGGVAITVSLGVPIFGIQPAVILLLLFTATGTPMVFENVDHHTKIDLAEREALKHGSEKTTTK